VEDWDVDGTVLRNGIRRLRAICTHPLVGQLQRQNDRFYKPGAVKSMGDVLQVWHFNRLFQRNTHINLQNMKDQNWRNFMDDWKSKVLCFTLELLRC
jgi:E3 ubiquitin-protein ligase SHPRH